MIQPKKVYDFDPRNLPPDLLQAIGLGMASAAQTESFIETAIWGCLGVDAEYGMAVTTHMAAPLRFSVLKSVAEIRINSIPLLDELDEIVRELDCALVKRNTFAHHSWARDPETGQLFTVTGESRSSLKVDLLPKTVDEVKIDALAIYNAGIRLWEFLIKANLVPAFPPYRPRGHKTKDARKKLRDKK